VIAVGDELTSGERVDTNSAWLSLRLAELGAPASMHVSVGDDARSIAAALERTAAEADVVVVTGGLGPTADDLTREAVAEFAGLDLVMVPEALRHIEKLFRSFGRRMPKTNRKQATIPAGSRIIPNPRGTAAGFEVRASGAVMFALPGVPVEMKAMFEASVAPVVARAAGRRRTHVVRRDLYCYGAGESTRAGIPRSAPS